MPDHSSVPPIVQRVDNAPRGILMMLVAVFLFSILNVLVKVTAEDYPLTQVTFFRNAFALLPVWATVMAQGGFGSIRTARPMGHLWRSCVGLTSMTLMFWSFHLLPLADAVALNFAAPLFLTALSVPLLSEQVGVHRWSAVAVGFVGVLIIVRPSPDMLNLGAIVALGAALAQSFAMIAIRQLSTSETANSIVFYFTLTTTLLSALTLPFAWRTPDLWGFALLVATGLVGGTAQLFMTRAYTLAPAAVIAPFNYASIVWAALFGWTLWYEVPDLHVVAGAAVVVASGCYILHRETLKHRAVVSGAAGED
ncbi:DMT family transporter [Azospirillum sp. TSO22-1]|uniref:DMT family transporter n=1 Tax=Azospirillum sp. TSO22-1 TaxID=716789 RepID=UPI000D60C797|nr:DMT family transporter [Azospirillum sp. TSO22-1]PWC44803.1 multidrug transporter [Azospirillum sp. TSO22-1]